MKSDEWNAKFPVGTAIRLWPQTGGDVLHLNTHTASEATVNNKGEHVIDTASEYGWVYLCNIQDLESYYQNAHKTASNL